MVGATSRLSNMSEQILSLEYYYYYYYYYYYENYDFNGRVVILPTN